MKALQVLAVLVTLLTLCHAIQTDYFARPNDSTPCPRLPCLMDLLHLLFEAPYSEWESRWFSQLMTGCGFSVDPAQLQRLSLVYLQDEWCQTLSGCSIHICVDDLVNHHGAHYLLVLWSGERLLELCPPSKDLASCSSENLSWVECCRCCWIVCLSFSRSSRLPSCQSLMHPTPTLKGMTLKL